MEAGHAPANRVALTFDDGPDPLWTPLVLDALAGSRATFFVVAEQARRYPSLLARMREEGHEVGFHCTRHVRHDVLSREEIDEDLETGLPALGRHVRLWRTPWGVVTRATREVARTHGLILAGWTSDTQDWRGSPTHEMFERVKADLLPGSIVLMHDGIGPGATRNGCAETVALVPRLVSLARSRSLEPVSLGDLQRPFPDENPDFAFSSRALDSN